MEVTNFDVVEEQVSDVGVVKNCFGRDVTTTNFKSRQLGIAVVRITSLVDDIFISVVSNQGAKVCLLYTSDAADE